MVLLRRRIHGPLHDVRLVGVPDEVLHIHGLLEAMERARGDDGSRVRREEALLPGIGALLGIIVEERRLRHGLVMHGEEIGSELCAEMSGKAVPLTKQAMGLNELYPKPMDYDLGFLGTLLFQGLRWPEGTDDLFKEILGDLSKE